MKRVCILVIGLFTLSVGSPFTQIQFQWIFLFEKSCPNILAYSNCFFDSCVCVCWWPATPRLEINWKKFFIVKISLFCKGGGKNLFHSCCLSICMELYSEKTLHVSQMSHDQNMFVWHLNSIFLSSLWWSFYSLIWTFFFILGY